ncbi:MAG: aminopeptidase P family protein [Candidatus Methanomethylicota archaeon]|uniref:Aminopeptidase P family protein n=1 Tax=Thermoproteota archaeon TaxID=2056631 RepID=A0A497EQE1_9CREN|nr:MAG: aminopeptidase P family protein [Candidatus Verstraetearchaeota archaeon]
MSRFSISISTYNRRIERVRKILESKNYDALILFSPIRIFYLTGYKVLPTERPIALIIPVKDELTLFVPKLEEEHSKFRVPHIKRRIVYFEYPGVKHPMKIFAKAVEEMKLHDKNLASDAPGYPGIMGYRGPKLSEILPKARITIAPEIIDDMRLIKDEEEIKLLKESAKWTNLAHRLLQDYTAPGLIETEIAMRASYEASVAMIKALGPEYDPGTPLPARAVFRGQIGKYSAYPHMLAGSMIIKEGDVLVTGAGANVGGYSAELERTMIVGKPNEKQEKYFNIMVKAQQAALNAFKPGIKACEVNKAAFKVFKEEGVPMEYVLHRVGHGIGLEGHEPPWIEDGDETILKPGMVFSCEPGIYIPGFAGFRHSDTVVITEDGVEVITYYPRNLEELIIPT